MKLRITALIMALIMIVLSIPVSAEGKYTTAKDYFPFTDIAEDKWYTPAVKFCYVNGFMKGVSNSLFDPSSITTREQMIMIIANMTKEDISSYTETSFNDVLPGKWYTSAIAWAEEKGYTDGIGENKFGLGLKITREEAVVMFYNHAVSDLTEPFDAEILTSYKDHKDVSDWAMEAVLWAVANGVIKGDNRNCIDPKGIMTRVQAAQMIYNLQLSVLGTSHKHEFTEPSCTEPARCISEDGVEGGCKLILSPAKGHSYDIPENCESYVTCNDCGELLFTPKGHDYTAATCISPMTCRKCGKTEGAALGHTVGIGVCGRCGEGLFKDNYQKLTYYLKEKGADRGSTKQLHARINYKNGDYAEQIVGYDLTANTCYIRLFYRFAKKGDNIDMKIYFDSISSSYTYTVDYLVDGKVEYSGTGTVDANSFNKNTSLKLDSYSGKDTSRKSLEGLCAPTLMLLLDGADHLLTGCADMSVKELGFKNF